MGGASSSTTANSGKGFIGERSDRFIGKDGREIIRLMMPVYYTEEPITPDEHYIAEQSWQKIVNNSAPEYVSHCQESQQFREKYATSIRFFSDCFYGRLFDVHPLSRPLFRDLTSQGKFLVKMITLSLTELSDPGKFESILVRLAEVHNHRGVKAVEYGIVGEVLLWSLRRCLGSDSFPAQVQIAWVKIYSRMLRIMVPVAVSYERQLNAEMLQDTLLTFANRQHAVGRHINADFIDPRLLNTTDAIIESLVQDTPRPAEMTRTTSPSLPKITE